MLRQKVVGPSVEQSAAIGRKAIYLKMCVTAANYSQVTTLMTQLWSLCIALPRILELQIWQK